MQPIPTQHPLRDLRVEIVNRYSGQTIARNIRNALSLGLPELQGGTESGAVAICGGGPSLSLYKGGMTTMALNGAVGLVRCEYAVCCDPTEENVNFYKGDLCRGQYLIGSRCDPAVFEQLKGRDVRLWHWHDSLEKSWDLRPRFNAGPSIGLAALLVAQYMGFDEIHLYGMDSCNVGGKHHAYSQPWNNEDTEKGIDIEVEGRWFNAAPWHVKQAQCYEYVWYWLQQADIKVVAHGEGLIAWYTELLDRECGSLRKDLATPPEGGGELCEGPEASRDTEPHPAA